MYASKFGMRPDCQQCIRDVSLNRSHARHGEWENANKLGSERSVPRVDRSGRFRLVPAVGGWAGQKAHSSDESNVLATLHVLMKLQRYTFLTTTPAY